MSWLGCRRQCKKNWKRHHIQNQSIFFTLVPDKWSRMHFSEYFNIFEYLHMKSKKYVTANPAPKNGKAISTELNVFEDDNFGRYVLEMKDYVSVSKGAHKQKLCNLQKSL